MLKPNFSFVIPLIFSIGISSCSVNKKENNKKTETQSVSVETEPHTIEAESIDYPISTPIKIAQMVSETVSDFNDTLTNQTDNTKKYRSGFTQSLNLGIYASDLSFVSIFDKQEAIMEYSSILNILSDEMHLTNCFDHAVLDKINESQDNPDSLFSSINTAILDTYRYMNKNDQAMAIVFLAGTWIESFYISTQLYKNAPIDEKCSSILSLHKQSLQVLVEMFETNDQNVGIKALQNDFEKIHNILVEIKDLRTPNDKFQSLAGNIVSLRNKCIN